MDVSRRVVITGMGAVSSIGNTVPELWASLLAGRGGVGPITRFDTTGFRTRIGGEVRDLKIDDYLDGKEAQRLDLFCHYAIVAAVQAMKDSGLEASPFDHERAGVFVGSGVGGIITFEEQAARLKAGGPSRVSPFLIPKLISDMASGCISIRFNLCGPNFSIVSACATGTHCIGEAWWAIRRGDADVMVAGGAEAPICPVGVGGFCAMRAMTERNDDPATASRPFDLNRDGFIIAEGAGVLVLESLEHAQARGARIYAEVIGYGATGDAHHITAPQPEGRGAVRAIEMAMRHAHLQPQDIGYINAHGTSTPLNDKTETLAIKTVLGEHAYKIPISSTKALTGHTLGAAGGIETIVCAKVLTDGQIPGTWNQFTADPNCDLDYVPNQTRQQQVDVALNMNFGFGGHNAVIAVRRWR